MKLIEILPNETWKEIEDLGGYYFISNLGNIKSINRELMVKNKWGNISKRFIKGKTIKSRLTNGYLGVGISLLGVRNDFFVHRLVASVFIPNPENKPMVNHINGIKTDNRVENLEWVTALENTQHAIVNKLIPENISNKQRIALLNGNTQKRKPILQYTKDGDFIKEWEYINQASKDLNISQSHISLCCKRETPSKKQEFIWKYKE